MKKNIKLQNIIKLMILPELSKLDLRKTENRIQQSIGMLTLIDNLDINNKIELRNLLLNLLEALYKRKKALLYGYKTEKNI